MVKRRQGVVKSYISNKVVVHISREYQQWLKAEPNILWAAAQQEKVGLPIRQLSDLVASSYLLDWEVCALESSSDFWSEAWVCEVQQPPISVPPLDSSYSKQVIRQATLMPNFLAQKSIPGYNIVIFTAPCSIAIYQVVISVPNILPKTCRGHVL